MKELILSLEKDFAFILNESENQQNPEAREDALAILGYGALISGISQSIYKGSKDKESVISIIQKYRALVDDYRKEYQA